MEIRNWILTIVMLILATMSMAQSQYELTPLEKKQLTDLQEPATLYKGFFRISVFSGFSSLGKFVDEDGNKSYFGNSTVYIFENDLSLRYGITDRMTVELSIPYTNFSLTATSSNESSFADFSQVTSFTRKSSGISDLVADVQYQLITENDRRPSFVVSLSLIMPTGEKNPTEIENEFEYKDPLGGGEFQLTLGLQIRKIIYPFTYQAYASYFHGFGGEKIRDVNAAALNFEGAKGFIGLAGGGIHINDWMTFSGFVSYTAFDNEKYEDIDEVLKTSSLNFRPLLNFQVKKLRITQSTSIFIVGKNTSTNPNYNLSIGYNL